MEKKILCGTELSVSPIALGTDVYGLTLDENESFAMLDFYTECGGNVIDTALIYGDWAPGEKSRSEKLIGRYLKKSKKRNELIISTKGAHPEIGHMDVPRLSEKEIRGDIEKSLLNLGVDYVDIYWLHRDHETADVEKVCRTLSSLVNEGKTRYIGLSNWTAKRIAEFNSVAEQEGLTKVCASQIQYSIAKSIPENNDPTLVLMNDSEYEFFKNEKMPVFAYASQAKGFFQKLAAGGKEALSEKAGTRYLCDENLKRFERIKSVAERYGKTVGETALAALISNPDFQVIPIVGCKNTAQLAETLKSAELKLSRDDINCITGGAPC